MQYETKKRSVLKAVSWRVCATVTIIFTGEFALAVTVGVLEVFAKMALYFFHERAWQGMRFGKKEIVPFIVWITGLPASGKKALGDAIHQLSRSPSAVKARSLAARSLVCGLYGLGAY